jgi:hypothetical protein
VYDERALDLLVFVTAVCTMSNRIVQGCGLTTPRPAGFHEAVVRLHRQGYAGTVQDIGAQAEHASPLRDREAEGLGRHPVHAQPPRGGDNTEGTAETFRPDLPGDRQGVGGGSLLR